MRHCCAFTLVCRAAFFFALSRWQWRQGSRAAVAEVRLTSLAEKSIRAARATAAAAAGAPLPLDRKIDGKDLTAHARGEVEGAPHESLFWRSGASQSALVNGWKLNLSDPPGKEWLFDVNVDPTEQRNLAKERPEKLAELRAALAAHNAEQAASSWPSLGSFPINIDKHLAIPDAPDDEYIYWSN